MPMDTLEAFFAPTSIDEFKARFLAKSLAHVRGTASKFADLITWEQINRILEQHRFIPADERIKLVRAGEDVDPAEYLTRLADGRWMLRAATFERQINDGATLIVHRIDELAPAVRVLAMRLERMFRTEIGANLYAGSGDQVGFRLHFDDHDTLIAQIAGRKYWRVYCPTRLHPLPGDPCTPLPAGEPAWEDMLEEGGMLYIPRGWWHVARAVREPFLHLTFALNVPTGMELLHWFVDRLKANVHCRQDVPYLEEAQRVREYARQMQQAISLAWSEDIVERFMASRDGSVLPRPLTQLPIVKSRHLLRLERGMPLQLVGRGQIDLSQPPKNGKLRFKCHGLEFECAESARPALRALNDFRSHTVEELAGLVTDRANPMTTSVVIAALFAAGVLHAANDELLYHPC